MKKIGVLTFHFPENKNFGASLQSYAVIKMLEKFNYKAELIDFNLLRITLRSKVKRLVLLKDIEDRIIGKNFFDYSQKFLKKGKYLRFLFQLKTLNNEYSDFLVGSDQVWRAVWFKRVASHYFFDFVDNSKNKIAYAASFGTDNWEGDKKLTEEIKFLIKRFNSISVREESGINICKETFGIDNAVCVLDPTLMISKEDYQPILDDWRDKSHLNKKYIAHMLLDDDEKLRNESQNIANYLKADINYIKGNYKKILWKSYFAYNKVSQWLTYLKDAELVITDSFHCTVFSIIFHKKFIVVANPKRGVARLETLLGKVGLKDRFFTNIENVIRSGVLDKEIDYNEVDKKLEVHRNYSMKFLKKALED